ncbi:hypothetical protein G2W53_001021 [Senna tora]|uniref:Uncharacterized protein n=1 Tax=Senna tora TaxID=362788 RepID=A0A834XHP5_9FABA|nr:hypothetical protein G2W53_001021 [Senna tora]
MRHKLPCKRPSTNPVAEPTSPTPTSQPSLSPIQVPSSPSQPAPQPLPQSKVPINIPEGYKVKSIPKRDLGLYWRATRRSQKLNLTSDSVPPEAAPSASKSKGKRKVEKEPFEKNTRARVQKGKSVLPPGLDSLPPHLRFDNVIHRSRYTDIQYFPIVQCKCLDLPTLDVLHLTDVVFEYAENIGLENASSKSHEEAFCDYPNEFVAAHAYKDLTGPSSASFDLSKSKDHTFLDPALIYIHQFLAYSFSGRKDNPRIVSKAELFCYAQPPEDNLENRDQEVISTLKIIKAQNDYIIYAFEKISEKLGVTLDPPSAI